MGDGWCLPGSWCGPSGSFGHREVRQPRGTMVKPSTRRCWSRRVARRRSRSTFSMSRRRFRERGTQVPDGHRVAEGYDKPGQAFLAFGLRAGGPHKRYHHHGRGAGTNARRSGRSCGSTTNAEEAMKFLRVRLQELEDPEHDARTRRDGHGRDLPDRRPRSSWC